ncbi:zinc-ribbon domain-containing protein [Mycobacteroides abscessus]|nr:zinc-ribbon domain-containing protein [Mycobacteroides abscessus]MDM2412025.1 zinc-ribbon domain-containing protein [Mycobacteroides abscessus]
MEWHPENELTPDDVSRGSDYRAKWRCARGHEWVQKVTVRAVGGNGCAFCAGRRVLTGFNDLAALHPDLALEWDPDNEVCPGEVYAGSKYRAKWICPKGHQWSTPVNLRTERGYGCRVCDGKQVEPGFNDLASKRPDLAALWHPDFNGSTRPSQVSARSNQHCWFRCAQGHSMLRTPSQIRSNTCAVCNGKHVVFGINDLASRYPAIAAEWHWSNGIDATMISWCSARRGAWQCMLGHRWETSVNSRVHAQSGCPTCAGQTVIRGVNDLASQRPDLLTEWHPDNELAATEVAVASSTKYMWSCRAHAHAWLASPANRSGRDRGCPVCAGRSVLSGFNDLASRYPSIAAEWHPDNDRRPDQVTSGARYRAKWLCAKKHAWIALVSSRTQRGDGTGCPTCQAGMLISRGEKAITALIRNVLGADVQILTSTRTVAGTTELDILVPDYKLAIEFNGLYWHSERTGRGKDFHLGKTKACNAAGLRLVHVWEDDWNFRRSGVERLIRSALGVFDGPPAAECDAVEIDFKRAVGLFAENCHTRAIGRASFFDALVHGDTVVAAVSSRLRHGRLDVMQFASAGVSGAAAVLAEQLKRRARLHGIECVRWVVDNATDDGTGPSTAGFTPLGELQPEFRYVRNGERVSRSSFRPARFRADPDLVFRTGRTEEQLAKLNGLDRIWDAGRTVWELSAG